MSNLSIFGAESSAIISPCGTWRYTLSRTWNCDLPGVLWVMLNPSTADASQDDPTIRRCMAYARAWECGSITVVNLFAFRASDPKALYECRTDDPDKAVGGMDNDKHIRRAVQYHSGREDCIIAAWGSHAGHKALKWRRQEVMNFLPLSDLLCLDTTQAGEPRHPLYCRADLTPTKYEGKQ